jgi:hypothetical protein
MQHTLVMTEIRRLRCCIVTSITVLSEGRYSKSNFPQLPFKLVNIANQLVGSLAKPSGFLDIYIAPHQRIVPPIPHTGGPL